MSYIAFTIFLLLALTQSQSSLQSDYITVTFNSNSGRISSINSKEFNKEITFDSGDDFGITINQTNVIYNLQSQESVNQKWTAKFTIINSSFAQTIFTSSNYSQFTVTANYELQSKWNFLSKTISIHCNTPNSGCNSYQIISYNSLLSSPNFTSYHIGADTIFGGGRQIALFTRFNDNSGFFQMMANPFSKYTPGTSATGPQTGIDRPGDDMSGYPIKLNSSDPNICWALCNNTKGCEAWAYGIPNCGGSDADPMCWLKSGNPNPTNNKCRVSGSQITSPQMASYSQYEYFKSGQITVDYITDRVLFGIYRLSKYQIITNANYLRRNMKNDGGKLWLNNNLKMDIVPTTLNPKYDISEEYDDATYTNIAERDIIISTVEHFLMDIEERKKYGSVKINVGWDENDYQLNIGTNQTQIAKYKRIFSRCSQYGIDHETFAPWNPLQASHQRATDNWGWEPVLWFTEGENIRQLIFNPWTDKIPNELSTMFMSANSLNVHLNAYVYPILGYENQTSWLYNPKTKTMGCASPNTTQCYATLANVDFQNYLSSLLIQYCEITSCGGYNWDYTFFQDPSYPNQYTQWKGWMRVIQTLRRFYNDNQRDHYLVMDHRQLNHIYGIWYQLAGSYAEPLASDENPETYGVAIPKLHTDHIATDFMRRQNYIYYQSQYQSSFRVPGFINHQTERGGTPTYDDHFDRDFDIIGTVYSTVANVGYAGMNMVFAMIPARDDEEFNKMPTKAINFTRYWLNFTDIYGFNYLRYTRPILSMPNSKVDAIDGTSAIGIDDSGFIFLYNSYYQNASVTLILDESIGISNNSKTDTFTITAVYPILNVIPPMNNLKFGDQVIIKVSAISAMILTVETTNSKITPTFSPYPMVIPPRPIAPKLPPSDFTSGAFSGEFYISSDVYKYLGNVNTTYPINWDIKQDVNVTWLMPYRLLLYINILQPVNASWKSSDLQLKIDNKLLDISLIKQAYNSRFPDGNRCFLGFYVDVTQDIAKPDVQHTLSLNIPSQWKLKPGQFQGVFFENLEASFFV
eukprot:71422_1